MFLFNDKINPYVIPFIETGMGIGFVKIRGYGKASVRLENDMLIFESYENNDPIGILLKDIAYLKFHERGFYPTRIRIGTECNEYLLTAMNNNDQELIIFYNSLLEEYNNYYREDIVHNQNYGEDMVCNQNFGEEIVHNQNSEYEINYSNDNTYLDETSRPKIEFISNIENFDKTNLKRININEASENELLKIQSLNDVNIKKIIKLRELNRTIQSWDDLKNILNLSINELYYIQDELSIHIEPEEKSIKNDGDEIKNENKLDFNFTGENSENDIQSSKIDLNRATLEELIKLPNINLIKAKKIIQLRNENNYVESYEDLGVKLNLTFEQINQIKELTVITNNNNSNSRIVDI